MELMLSKDHAVPKRSAGRLSLLHGMHLNSGIYSWTGRLSNLGVLRDWWPYPNIRDNKPCSEIWTFSFIVFPFKLPFGGDFQLAMLDYRRVPQLTTFNICTEDPQFHTHIQIYSNIFKYIQIYSNIFKYIQIYSNIFKYIQIYSNITMLVKSWS